MNILITGAAGALDRNLVENLKAIRDGKNRTRPNLKIDSIYEYDRNNTAEDLNHFYSDCDFIVHAAGVNRPKENSEFMDGNFGFTSTLLDCLKRHSNKAPIMITNSVQATLSVGLAIPNMVGKWIHPRYNSAVGTFCYCIAKEEPITVNDSSVLMEMVSFNDICEEIYDAMEGHPRRCHYDGVEATPDGNGRYCHCPVKHKATLREIVGLLHKFHDFPQD